jgi:xylulose-5-phosphate/fructose-6-phosphate phosphoketolase
MTDPALHVRGYKEEGTTATPFDMVVRNDMDRFHLVEDVIARVPNLAARSAGVLDLIRERLNEHTTYIGIPGEDLPDIRDWRWDEQRVHEGSRPDTAADF